MVEHTHTIPVDPSLTAQEAWDELCLMGVRATNTGEPTWMNIKCDGEECWNIATERDSAPPRDADREPANSADSGSNARARSGVSEDPRGGDDA